MYAFTSLLGGFFLGYIMAKYVKRNRFFDYAKNVQVGAFHHSLIHNLIHTCIATTYFGFPQVFLPILLSSFIVGLHIFLKITYFEKAPKFCEIFPLHLTECYWHVHFFH